MLAKPPSRKASGRQAAKLFFSFAPSREKNKVSRQDTKPACGRQAAKSQRHLNVSQGRLLKINEPKCCFFQLKIVD